MMTAATAGDFTDSRQEYRQKLGAHDVEILSTTMLAIKKPCWLWLLALPHAVQLLDGPRIHPAFGHFW